MIVVAAVGALVVVGLLVGSAIGMATQHRGTGPLVALAGGLLLVVVLGAFVAANAGSRHRETDSTPAPAPIATPAAAAIRTTDKRTAAPTVPRSAIDGPEVYMESSTAGAYGSTPPIVDRLAARSVLRITATGFETNGTGFVEQCTVAGCGNLFPVVFDATGTARLQYLVDDAFATGFAPPSRCRADQPPCVVHLNGNGHSGYLTTVFRDIAPALPRVKVEPNAWDLVDGFPLRVAVTGFRPGDRVQAMLCAAPDTHGPTRCGRPGPVSSFTIGPKGTGRTILVIRTGRVGSAGASCGRDAPCAIVVSHATSFVPAPAIPIAFAAGSAARYDPSRWVTGLGIALVLFTLAFFLARNTDWRKPTEADTPDLDRAFIGSSER